MKLLALDYETQSAADIDDGASAYAEHESTRVLCGVFILYDDREGIAEVSRWTPAEPLPAWAVRHASAGGRLLAHNHSFEASINRYCLPQFPAVCAEQWIDTLQLAAVLGLPLGLAGLGAAIGAVVQKDDEGHRLMLRLSAIRKNRKGELVVPEVTPADLERLLDYCEIDVRATIECWRRLPAVPAAEHRLMAVDHRINERGVALDFDLAASMQTIVEARRAEIMGEVWHITGDLIDVSSPAALMNYARDHGVKLPKAVRTRADGSKHVTESIGREAIDELLDRPDLPAELRKALHLRIEAGRVTSLAKLGRLGSVANADGRARWLLRYAKATTGRWASEVLQLHNLPRPSKAFSAWSAVALEAVRNRDIERISAVHAVLEALSFLLRALVIARPGKVLFGGDYAAIEARIVAWLAGQDDVLAMFASGTDVYVADAAAIGSDNRNLGKACRLGLGFQMGAVRFVDSAAKHGVSVEPKRAREVVTGWRKANPCIVQLWRDLEDAFAEAHRAGAGEFLVGPHLVVRGGRENVRIMLPSGRQLYYWRAHERPMVKKIEVVNDDGLIETREIEGVAQRYYARQGARMVVEDTYGGHLTENVTQAVARDLLRDALFRLDGSPFEVVLHVHDSIAAEGDPGLSLPDFIASMATLPDWAPGLPVNVEGYTSRHFKG